jgi:hypothetical protein
MSGEPIGPECARFQVRMAMVGTAREGEGSSALKFVAAAGGTAMRLIGRACHRRRASVCECGPSVAQCLPLG